MRSSEDIFDLDISFLLPFYRSLLGARIVYQIDKVLLYFILLLISVIVYGNLIYFVYENESNLTLLYQNLSSS